MFGEAGDAAEDGRTEEDSPDDFCDDSRLSHVREGIVEEADEDDDDASLNR